jgi:hypothetical protein
MAWITHPQLDGRLVEVPDSAVMVWAAAGWQEADPPAPPTPPEQTAAAPRRRSKSQPAGPASTTEE